MMHHQSLYLWERKSTGHAGIAEEQNMVVVLTRKRLVSKQFKDNQKLQRCLLSPADHVLPGSRGEHVGLIQEALTKLGMGVIGASEISTELYGQSTQQAVLRYKGPPRNIINTDYQRTPDNIVGQMTIDRLDADMVEFEKVPESLLVTLTEAGPKHDHSKCPTLQSGGHKGTPINPLPFGKRINIYGTHETDYLGFDDYAPNPNFAGRGQGDPSPPRFLTNAPPHLHGLEAKSVSNIAIRSSPIFANHVHSNPNEVEEILRVAMPGCRVTYAGTDENFSTFGPTVLRFGPVIERHVLTTRDPGTTADSHFHVIVLVILDPDTVLRSFQLPPFL
ncbi:hypothetical protein XH96_18830 [Bradyrhizobium sp. CCBAU 51765]|nr:hypothetical protein XH96_18830 [Bradyrhizobium sp. CCBAU 51765]